MSEFEYQVLTFDRHTSKAEARQVQRWDPFDELREEFAPFFCSAP